MTHQAMVRQLTDTIPIPDTLTSHAGVDSLLLESPSLSLRPDNISLFCHNGTNDHLMSTADAVYGPLSKLSESYYSSPPTDGAILTDTIFFDLAVLACFIAFCLILYLYRGYAVGIFNAIRGGMATEKMLGERSNVFGEFLFRIIATGLLVAGLTTLKFIDLFNVVPYVGELPGWGAPVLIPVAWAAIALIWWFQLMLIRIAGKLTLSREFTTQLFFVKKITFAIWTITVLPLFFLFALSDGQTALILGVIITGITLLAAFFLIIRSFTLFLRHNFSISLWILYLCAVEIFPISIVAAMLRKFLV